MFQLPEELQERVNASIQGVVYTAPAHKRLFFMPGAKLKVPARAVGSAEGHAVEVTFTEPEGWECAYGCRGLAALPAIQATHTWDCDYWYREGRNETPFD